MFVVDTIILFSFNWKHGLLVSSDRILFLFDCFDRAELYNLLCFNEYSLFDCFDRTKLQFTLFSARMNQQHFLNLFLGVSIECQNEIIFLLEWMFRLLWFVLIKKSRTNACFVCFDLYWLKKAEQKWELLVLFDEKILRSKATRLVTIHFVQNNKMEIFVSFEQNNVCCLNINLICSNEVTCLFCSN
jgi:hypothetical protein